MSKTFLASFLLATFLIYGGIAYVRASKDVKAAQPSTLSISNTTATPTTVYVAFGADSTIVAASWPFCAGSGLNCFFPLGPHITKDMPLKGQYLNATISFGAAVTCGVTKAEVNLNNPGWYDTTDVSLVDGFSNKISITATTYGKKPVVLGPPNGREGNEKVYGLFPYGCDICVARQAPPCGIPRGRTGCKSGTQYAPSVICQYQGPAKVGGEQIQIRLH